MSSLRCARISMTCQELGSQLEALRRAECHKVFKEKSSTRVKIRPELEKALALAHQFKEAAPETPVILTVHELKRLARIERNYIREKALEGQVMAASKGNHGGLPKVIDDDMLIFAVALKDKGVPVPDIAQKLTIKTGKTPGKHPSPALLYRALAEAETAAVDDGLPIRPTPVRLRRPGEPLTAEGRRAAVDRPTTSIKSMITGLGAAVPLCPKAGVRRCGAVSPSRSSSCRWSSSRRDGTRVSGLRAAGG
ncbi:recombinase family protein [Streptomyces goshikiensis]|uniref:recombinase family protein n=1 Tax=Streptomyces goshikiensis TaxID=1942 RepID=UPI00379C3CB7